MRDFFINEEKQKIAILIISAISLVLSIFNPFNNSIDIAWIAVILCGTPILREAIIGLVTRFDIKADVLVSIALIASVMIGSIFVARRSRIYHGFRRSIRKFYF